MGNISSSDDEDAGYDELDERDQQMLHRQITDKEHNPVHNPNDYFVYPTSSSTQLIMPKKQVYQLQRLYAKQILHRGDRYPGTAIFAGIFSTQPKTRNVFADYAKKHNFVVEYERHYKAFSGAMAHVMANLHKPDEVSQYLRQLGARHVHFRSSGFDVAYWNTFGDCMIKCTFDWGNKRDRTLKLREAWSKIILFIIGTMREGYYTERRRVAHEAHANNCHLQVNGHDARKCGSYTDLTNTQDSTSCQEIIIDPKNNIYPHSITDFDIAQTYGIRRSLSR